MNLRLDNTKEILVKVLKFFILSCTHLVFEVFLTMFSGCEEEKKHQREHRRNNDEEGEQTDLR